MEIREMIRKIASDELKDVRSVVCKVVSVDKANCQAELEPVDGSPNLLAVRLSATESKNNTVVIYPTRGSYVIATMLNETDAFISMTDEADNIEVMNHGDYVLQNEGEVEIISGKKVILKNDKTSLKTILNDLISELKAAIINTPSGAGTVSPATTAKLDLIDNKINQLMKE